MDEIVVIEQSFETYAAYFARALADPPEVDVEATAVAALTPSQLDARQWGVRVG